MNLLSKIYSLIAPQRPNGGNTKSPRSLDVKTLQIGDIQLAYYIRGKGEPLVMVMGFRGTMSMWDPALLELLEKKYTLILFDNRGIGLSTDNNNVEITISHMVEDTASLIKALGYRNVHLLGWSVGSLIAQVLTINHPELVRSLILCSPYPSGRYMRFGCKDDLMKMADPNLSAEEILSIIFPKTISGKQDAQTYAARLSKAIASESIPNDMVISSQAILRRANILSFWLKDDQFTDALHKVICPTLIAVGLDDSINPVENAIIIARRIPHAWFINFPNAGHNFLSPNYRALASIIESFIESNKNMY